VETSLKSESFELFMDLQHFWFKSYGKITKVWMKKILLIFTQNWVSVLS